MKLQKRASNIEVLRIICMYMIVMIHANMYLSYFCKGWTWSIYNGAVNGICNIGVTCFILISGYFGMDFKLKKLLKMEIMMIGFSVLETVILCITMPETMSGVALLEQLVKSFFPFITRKYWFYSCYVCIFCFSEFINKFVDSLEKDTLKKLLKLLLLLFCVFPTVFYFEIVPDNGKGLWQMIIIYILGRYMHKYGNIGLSTTKILVIFGGVWILNGISHEFPIQLGGIYHHLCKDNSITNILMAVLLFNLFKNWELQSDVINGLTKHIFAVFALNNSMITAVMTVIINLGILTPTLYGWIWLMVLSLGVMLMCLLLGALREKMFGKIENVLIQKIIGIDM